MNRTGPTLAPPMSPSTVDMGSIFAAHAERTARIDALRPGNKDRLFDGLMAAGITHVTVPFDGADDSGRSKASAHGPATRPSTSPRPKSPMPH